MDRHGAIGTDGDAVDQLFEVRAVVLVVAEGDARRALPLFLGGLLGIVAVEGDGSRVLMQFAQVNGKLAHGVRDQGGQQAGAIGTLQVIQCPADAVIIEQGQLVRLQTEVLAHASRRPGGDGVERLTRQQQIGEQHSQDKRSRQGRLAAGGGGQVAVKQLRQSQAVEEVADQGSGTHFQRLQANTVQVGRTHGNLAWRKQLARGGR